MEPFEEIYKFIVTPCKISLATTPEDKDQENLEDDSVETAWRIFAANSIQEWGEDDCSLTQCCGCVTFWYGTGAGSSDP
jgi:hypothetical protein